MQPAVKRHTKQCTIQQQILNTCCTIQECLLQSCYNHDGSMTRANVYNGPCKQIEEKRRVNDNRMKDHPKSSLINLNKQYFLHYYFTTMTRQDTHSHLGFLLSELLLSWHSLLLILLSPSCVFAAILSYLKYVLFCPIQKPSAFFFFLFTNPWCTDHWLENSVLSFSCPPEHNKKLVHHPDYHQMQKSWRYLAFMKSSTSLHVLLPSFIYWTIASYPAEEVRSAFW